jgi:hypothetical protein
MSSEVGDTLTNIGSLYLQKKLYKKALENYKKALEIEVKFES